MARPTQLITKSFDIDTDPNSIAEAVEQIRECHNLAEAAFSGRPVSLCKSLERRGEMRVKLEEPIYLHPLEIDGTQATAPAEQAIVGIAQDISNHGVGVSYDQPLLTDHFLADFDLFGRGGISLIVEVRWRQQLASHSYTAGGLVVGIAASIQ